MRLEQPVLWRKLESKKKVPRAFGAFASDDMDSVAKILINSDVPLLEKCFKRGLSPKQIDHNGFDLISLLIRSMGPWNAESSKELELLEVMLKQGVSVNEHKNSRPLHLAVLKQSSVIVNRLLAAGADILVADANGTSVLHCIGRLDSSMDASMDQRCKMLATLIDRGADPLARDNNGRIPLDVLKMYSGEDASLTPLVLMLSAYTEAAVLRQQTGQSYGMGSPPEGAFKIRL